MHTVMLAHAVSLPARSMNPLNLKAKRFMVAARESDGAIQGFGQLAPLGGAPDDGPQWLELRSLIVDPEHRCVVFKSRPEAC